MPNTNQTLSHCPACGSELEVEPVRGSCLYFICPTHRRFGISLTAIAMMNESQFHAENVGRRLESARASEREIVITSNDLP